MIISKKRIAIYTLISLSLFAAFFPVILSNNYLRQDDLIMWQIWPGMKISQAEYFYYNTVFQLVRPLCMVSFFITDLISLNIHNAVYVRLFSILCLCALGILLYRWQIKFNSNRILAATFAVCAFTLPPFQIFAATQNYSLVLAALLMTFGAVFYWYKSFHDNSSKGSHYFWIGCFLFFASLIDYPLSSMFAWVLLCIYYLNILSAKDFTEKKKFFYFGSMTTFLMMVLYYIVIHYVHHIFEVDTSLRAAVIDSSHIFTRLLGIFDVMSWHSNMWLWNDTTTWKNSPIAIICILFISALTQLNLQNQYSNIHVLIKNVALTLAIIFALFFISFSPIMAAPDKPTTFRYAICTMPMLLYITFWSIDKISMFLGNLFFAKLCKLICSTLFITLTLFGIGYANLMLSDGIVGPHEQEFNYMQQQLTEKVLPLLKQHKKVALHIIDCSEAHPYPYPNNIPMAFEYSMRVCSEFQQEAISVVTHSLNLYGYPSNFNRHNTILWNDKELVVRDIPWGDMIVNNVEDPHLAQLHYAANDTPTLVTIDMRQEPIYQHMQFYKKKLGI